MAQDMTFERGPESFDPDYKESEEMADETQPEGSDPIDVNIVEDNEASTSTSDNPIAEKIKLREEGEEGRPPQAIADDELAAPKNSDVPHDFREPAEARSVGDLDNTVPWDMGNPGTPVKDIANGLAEAPEFPDLPRDHPEYEKFVRLQAEREAEKIRSEAGLGS